MPSPSPGPDPTGDNPDALLETWRAIAEAATPAPWWFDESDQCWRLHGVAARIPAPPPLHEQIVNKQILKAPKCGTPYAEYWPEPADARFIIAARTAMPRLLAAISAVLELADELENTPWSETGGDRANIAVETYRLSGMAIRKRVRSSLAGDSSNEKARSWPDGFASPSR